MSSPVLFGGHKNAGFFVHALNAYYGGVPGESGINALQTANIDKFSDDDIANYAHFSLIIPVLDEWRAYSEVEFPAILRPSVISAINDKRCTLLFDYSNEAGTSKIVKSLSELLKKIGIDNPSECWLICQNRFLGQGGSEYIRVIHFDFFILAGVVASASGLSKTVKSSLIEAIAKNNKKHDLTCLNATPRMHRILTLLEMLNQDLINIEAYSKESTISIPYISMPRLQDTKESALTIDEIRISLERLKLTHLSNHLGWLIDALPLKADQLSEKGNQLATKVILEHYLETNLSIVTETGIDEGIERITEKTVKALCHGHPLVIVGHENSVRVAKSLGFSLMDDFIDHSYDSINEPISRIHCAIGSAKEFLGLLRTNKLSCEEISAHTDHNVTWATDGFLVFYWGQYVKPILSILRL